MADMSVPSLLESLEAHIFRRSMRRRTAPSSRGPVFPDTGFEPNLLPWFRSKRQTAFPPPSSGCHHFHKAPSSDGASFFAPPFCAICGSPNEPPGIARPERKASLRNVPLFAHGSPSHFAFVGLGPTPHNPLQEIAASPPPWLLLAGHRLRPMTRRPRSSPRARPFHFQADLAARQKLPRRRQPTP